MMRILFGCILLSVCLSCQAQYSYDDYLSNPKQLMQRIEQCQVLDNMKTPDCQTAQRALRKIRPLLVELVENNERYGLRILHLQMQLAQTQDVKEKQRLQQRYQLLLSLLRFAEQLG